MTADDERVLRETAERSAAILTGAGFPKMPARALMALVTSSTGGMTAAELSDRLGASAAAISGAVRYLQTIGVVHRVAQPGSRRDRYEILDDAWYAASLRKNPVFELLADAAEQAQAALEQPESPAGRRMGEMASFYRFIHERMPELLDEWERSR